MANAIVEYIGGIEVVKAFSQSAGSYKKYSDAVDYNANYYVDWMRENQKTMSAYAHTQDKPRLELTEKIEANFYSQDLTPAASQPRQNEKPAATKISGKEILEAIRLMDADERRELTKALFA